MIAAIQPYQNRMLENTVICLRILALLMLFFSLGFQDVYFKDRSQKKSPKVYNDDFRMAVTLGCGSIILMWISVCI